MGLHEDTPSLLTLNGSSFSARNISGMGVSAMVDSDASLLELAMLVTKIILDLRSRQRVRRHTFAKGLDQTCEQFSSERPDDFVVSEPIV